MKTLTSLQWVVVACLAFCGVVSGQQEEVTQAEFAKTFVLPDSLIRHNTWKRLNPEDTTQYKWIVRILQAKSWFDRDGAATALAKAWTESTLKRITNDLKRHRDPFVRQGMAVALAKMDDPKFYGALYEALDDKHPFVRRVVVHSLRVHKKPAAVGALVDRFQTETDPIVRTFIQDSLDELTQAYQGTNPLAWLSWWQEAQKDADFKLGMIDEEAKAAAEKLGRKLRQRKTLSAAVTLVTSERGRLTPELGGVPVLVIPPYSSSKEIMLPFLAELEQVNKLFYIDLPPLKSFKGLKTAGKTDIPYYPIDQLVEAFEELRKETEQERFALMACGMNSWIAMRYASLNPKSVSHLILISPLSSGQAQGNATQRMEGLGRKNNDVELWHYALTRRFNTETGESQHDRLHRERKLPKPDGEAESIARRSWSARFANPQDSLLGVLYPDSVRYLGGVAIPDFKCFQEPRRNIPTLVIVGKHALHASVPDCQLVAKHYRGRCLVYPKSAFLPFAEEGPRFFKDVSRFLGNKSPKKTKARPRKKKTRKRQPSS